MRERRRRGGHNDREGEVVRANDASHTMCKRRGRRQYEALVVLSSR